MLLKINGQAAALEINIRWFAFKLHLHHYDENNSWSIMSYAYVCRNTFIRWLFIFMSLDSKLFFNIATA